MADKDCRIPCQVGRVRLLQGSSQRQRRRGTTFTWDMTSMRVLYDIGGGHKLGKRSTYCKLHSRGAPSVVRKYEHFNGNTV